MFQVPSLVVLLGLTLCILPSHKTMAQQFGDSDVVYEAARNRIGLIRYCRSHQLLEPVIAGQAITAMETGLRGLPSSDSFARERGDRAQHAGEDGFWDAGRRRDIAGVAKLFRTTPAELCQEWADETLRAQKHHGEVTTTAVTAPIQPEPPPQAEPTPVEPVHGDGQPARATAAVTPVRSAPPPPLPEKAPFRPVAAELASLQLTLPTGGHLGYSGRAVPGDMSGTAAVTPGATPQSSGQTVALSAPPATEAAEPLPGEQTVTAAAPSPRVYDQPQPLPKEGLFSRLGKRERCFMPGCTWRAPQERRSWQY